MICPPYSWWCYPGCVPGTIVTDSQTSTDFGFNLALGLTFAVGMDSMIYVQAQYNSDQRQSSAAGTGTATGVRGGWQHR